jgi:hypothetical protein
MTPAANARKVVTMVGKGIHPTHSYPARVIVIGMQPGLKEGEDLDDEQVMSTNHKAKIKGRRVRGYTCVLFRECSSAIHSKVPNC